MILGIARFHQRFLAISLAVLGAVSLSACDQSSSNSPPTTQASGGDAAGKEKVNVAFVTNNPSDFWSIARAGVEKAEKDFNATCEFQMPPSGTPAEQQQIIEALLAKGVQGIAISPDDPKNQTEMLNAAAARVPLICQDSDAPDSNRVAYVGTNNVEAGRAAGKLIKEVLPDGGDIMLFVGQIDAQNAKERAEGIKKELEGSKVKVLDIRTDETDRNKAQQNVEAVLASNPNIGCLVGLWSYNGPAILQAVKGAKKEGKVNIVCFDEENDTLQGVKDGYIYATVVQQPYQFGYQAVKVLSALARGEDAGIPDNKVISIPVKSIKKDNVDTFWTELKNLRGK